MTDSLSGGWQLVTWILAGVVVPVDTDAAIVCASELLDGGPVSECSVKMARIPMRRAAETESSGAKMPGEMTMPHVVVTCFSHLDTSAGHDACRRVATLNFRGFSFLGFASEAIACRRVATNSFWGV